MKEKPQPKELTQGIINAYEGFIKNVYEACRFVEMGSGKKHSGVFQILVPIINEHEKDMWRDIEKEMDKEPDMHKDFKETPND
jgi:hypothetical protein